MTNETQNKVDSPLSPELQHAVDELCEAMKLSKKQMDKIYDDGVSEMERVREEADCFFTIVLTNSPLKGLKAQSPPVCKKVSLFGSNLFPLEETPTGLSSPYCDYPHMKKWLIKNELNIIGMRAIVPDYIDGIDYAIGLDKSMTKESFENWRVYKTNPFGYSVSDPINPLYYYNEEKQALKNMIDIPFKTAIDGDTVLELFVWKSLNITFYCKQNKLPPILSMMNKKEIRKAKKRSKKTSKTHKPKKSNSTKRSRKK